MRNGETFARDDIDITAFQLVAWRETDRMHDDIKAIPVLAETCRQCVELFVTGDIQRQHDIGTEFLREFLDATFQLVSYIGEGKFCTFAFHCFGNAVGDGAIAGEACDEGAFTGKKTHDDYLFSCIRSIAW